MLVPLEDIQDAARIAANIIMDGGNGQPLDMIPFEIGEAVMFDGMSMHMTLVGDSMLALVTGDLYTGSLNLDTNPTVFPNRIHNMRAEYDFAELRARLA